jgi:mycothiol synthase
MSAAPSDTGTVLQIAEAARTADGVDPLDEATRLDLRDGRAAVEVDVDRGGFTLRRGSELTLVVHPDRRGRGLGSRLLGAALAAYDDSGEADDLAVWSHGDHPAAARLARRHGWERVRDLWVMRRPAAEPLPELPAGPEGPPVRGYRPEDRDELLRVNAAAFADHPEQGAMDEADLARRMAEPWWDPAGLLVAPRAGGGLDGFHWTKQHDATTGEVYVVGVDPAAQGRGLGRVLTLAGLHHLAALGVDEVILYVESDNTPAVAVYERLGFGHAASDTHVMYRRTSSSDTVG